MIATLKVSFVLFDLDGTLTDSEQGIVASYRHALGAMGLDAPDGAIRRWIGPPLTDGFAGLGVPDGEISTAIDLYRAHFSTIGIYQNRLFPGVLEMLTALRGAGITLAIATSKLSEFAATIADYLEIAPFFSAIAGASRDGTRLHKADIAGFGLELLGQPEPSQVALVGDREHDVSAAIALGLHAIGATWGYGTNSELADSGAEYLISAPEELSQLLRLREGPAPSGLA